MPLPQSASVQTDASHGMGMKAGANFNLRSGRTTPDAEEPRGRPAVLLWEVVANYSKRIELTIWSISAISAGVIKSKIHSTIVSRVPCTSRIQKR